jgi:hypothetical protein
MVESPAPGEGIRKMDSCRASAFQSCKRSLFDMDRLGSKAIAAFALHNRLDTMPQSRMKRLRTTKAGTDHKKRKRIRFLCFL